MKSHNTAETSKEVFIDLTNSHRLIDEKRLVYSIIEAHGPITSRRLSELADIERSSVCRSLYDLENEITPSIKVAFVEKCPVTNRRVKHYSTINWTKPPLTQGKIF